MMPPRAAVRSRRRIVVRPSSAVQGYGPAWRRLREKVIEAHGNVCDIDGEEGRAGDPLDVDHRVPRSQGGSDDYENLRVLHHSEHSRKTVLLDGGFGRRPR